MIDNYSIFLYVIGGIVSITAFILWYAVGRDPKVKTTFAQYEIPENLSPGLACFIYHTYYTSFIELSTLLGLAQKKAVLIRNYKSKYFIPGNTYKILINKKPGGNINLTTDEKLFLNCFFTKEHTVLILDPMNRTPISQGSIKFKKKFEKLVSEKYIEYNRFYFRIFLLFAFSLVMIYAITFGAVLKLIMPTITALVLSALFVAYYEFIRVYFFKKRPRRRIGGIKRVSGLVLVSAFVFPWCIALLAVTQNTIFMMLGMITIIIPIYVLSYEIRRWTSEGAELQEITYGLKEFIEKVEKHRMEIAHNSLPKDITQTSEYLPYSAAFDLQPGWVEDLRHQFLKQYIKKESWNQE